MGSSSQAYDCWRPESGGFKQAEGSINTAYRKFSARLRPVTAILGRKWSHPLERRAAQTLSHSP
jgi:hypothetical protein